MVSASLGVWVTALGESIPYCQLSDLHLENTIRWLIRKAVDAQYATLLQVAFAPPFGGDAANDAVDAEMDELQEGSPYDWGLRQEEEEEGSLRHLKPLTEEMFRRYPAGRGVLEADWRKYAEDYRERRRERDAPMWRRLFVKAFANAVAAPADGWPGSEITPDTVLQLGDLVGSKPEMSADVPRYWVGRTLAEADAHDRNDPQSVRYQSQERLRGWRPRQ